jgi:radical SAM superfamily enzyme with C-terminal helix-hairpin-helix motif
MRNFNEYLEAHNGLNSDEETKNRLFQKFRKEYQKEYNKTRKQHSKLVQLWLELPEYEVLSEDAGKLGLRVTEFVRNILKAQKEQSYVLPDEKILYDLIISLTRLGTNLNQISFLCNKEKRVGYKEIKEVQEIFKKIERTAMNHFQPLHLENYIRKQAEINPMFIYHLERIIQDYKDLKL